MATFGIKNKNASATQYTAKQLHGFRITGSLDFVHHVVFPPPQKNPHTNEHVSETGCFPSSVVV
jgi:hypothetical protein